MGKEGTNENAKDVVVYKSNAMRYDVTVPYIYM